MTIRQLRQETADYLRYLRITSGLKQKELAELIGVSRTVISSIEIGSREAGFIQFLQITDACGTKSERAYREVLTGCWRRKLKL